MDDPKHKLGFSFSDEELHHMTLSIELLSPNVDRTNFRNIELLIQSIIYDKQTQRYFTHGRIIGRGSFALVIRIDVAEIPKLAVVKAHYTTDDTYLVEYLINRQLNSLRDEIPNFVYTYGVFLGNNPMPTLASLNRFPLFWNLTPGHTVHIVYEYINGRELTDQLSELTPELVIMILGQIFLSLQLAQERFDFTHYDLHTGNILIQKLETPRTITYSLKQNTYQLTTTHLCTIIDFGYSYSTGHSSSKMGKHSWPYFDWFKFMNILTVTCIEDELPIQTFLKQCMKLVLDEEELTSSLNNDILYEQRYELPKKFTGHSDYTHLKFIQQLLTIQPGPIIQDLEIKSKPGKMSIIEWPWRTESYNPSLYYVKKLAANKVFVTDEIMEKTKKLTQEKWLEYQTQIRTRLDALSFSSPTLALSNAVYIRSLLDRQRRLTDELDNQPEYDRLKSKLQIDKVLKEQASFVPNVEISTALEYLDT